MTQTKTKTDKGTEKVAAKIAKIAIIMGSDSDYPIMKEAEMVLKFFEITFNTAIISAHRTPLEMVEFAKSARKNGYQIIIAGAGGAAHLPGMVAAISDLPVIGVPVPNGVMQGEDALLSIVQMPKGVPVATVAIGNSWNAGVLAAQILSLSDPDLAGRISKYKDEMRKNVLDKKLH